MRESRSSLANLVRLIHIFVIAFVILTPFIPKMHWCVLTIHIVGCISLLFHWYLQEDACILTIIECSLRGVPITDSFMYSLVNPVYKIKDETVRLIAAVGTPILALISMYRVCMMMDVVKADIRLLLNVSLAVMQ